MKLLKSIAAVGAFTALAAVAFTTPTHAAVDSTGCIVYSDATDPTPGVVQNYNEYVNNDVNQGECPTYVEIPSTISGTTITRIGSASFVNSKVTAVTAPSTLTSIGDGAFQGSALEYIELSSVPTFEANAFALTGATPVTGAPYYTDLDNVHYVHLIVGPTPALQNTVYAPSDWNDDGTDDLSGGYIILPTTATVTFTDEDGTELRPSQTYVSTNGATDYLVSSNPDPTTVAGYITVGRTYDFNAPAISGYTITNESDYDAMTVDYVNDQVDFVYAVAETPTTPTTPTTPADTDDTAEAVATSTSSDEMLADTGVNAVVLTLVALSAMGAGAVLVVRRLA